MLEPYPGRRAYAHHGQRVVAGQRLMQAATDIFLGWQSIEGLDGVKRDYYVRQFRDWKGGADAESLPVPGATWCTRGSAGHPGPGARAVGHGSRSRPTSATAMPSISECRVRGRLRRPERARLLGVHCGRPTPDG